MKIVIATDSYKGSGSSLTIAKAIEKGLLKSKLDLEIVKVAVADGGEGSMESLVLAFGGFYEPVLVLDPLGREIMAKYGVLDKDSVIIEMASASGLTLISKKDLLPLKASTYGTGQLIKAALDKGYKNIYLGLGGSATTDGGVGALMALGGAFLDKNGQDVSFGNIGLKSIETIDMSKLDKRLEKVSITILSDVSNPLLKKSGAACVFGPQKGASPDQVLEMESNLNHFSIKVEKTINRDLSKVAGAGAAGGLGFGLLAFCQAKIVVGVDKILEMINFKEIIKNAEIVITGEGRIDGQSIYGKTPIGVSRFAKMENILTVAIVGSVGDKADLVYDYGIDVIVDIINKPMSEKAAINNVEHLVSMAAFNFIHTYKVIKKHKI